jgi:hypothetical protein
MATSIPSKGTAMDISKHINRTLLEAAADFVHYSWPKGISGFTEEDTRRFRITTPRYGLDFDINTGSIQRWLVWDAPIAEESAFETAAHAGAGSQAELQLRLETSGGVFTAFGWKNPITGLNVLETGKYVTWIRLTDLEFRDGDGKPFPGAKPELEIVFWAEKLHIIARMSCQRQLQIGRLALSFAWPKDRPSRIRNRNREGIVLPHHRAGLLGAEGVSPITLTEAEANTLIEAVSYDMTHYQGHMLLLQPGEHLTAAMQIVALDQKGPMAAFRQVLAAESKPPAIALSCPEVPGSAPIARYDALRGWYSLPIPQPIVNPTESPDYLQRCAISVENASRIPQRIRLRGAMNYPYALPGTCPMLLDSEGFPVGLPVQISKNWHGMTYLHAHTVITLPAQSRADMEMTFAYENWGGKPVASHAQLCLVGWDSDPSMRQGVQLRCQVWEEMALGIRSEHICYDPDVCQGRSFVDDIRALLSTDMSGGKRGFASNVGGADFLVYWPSEDEPAWEWPVGAITRWHKYGPNITETLYEFTSTDGKIRGRARARSYATDDMTRGIYDLRYDVLADTEYARLALFTLGADKYNGSVNRKAAQGDPSGVAREWALKDIAEEGYWLKDIACSAPDTWFALYDETHGPTDQVGGANRGLVIRSYRAVLNGRESGSPLAAFRGNRNADQPSVILELQPDAGGHLKAGDYIEMQVEMLLYPQTAEHYYGPNRVMRQLLKDHGDSWQPVLTASKPRAVEVVTGTLRGNNPIIVQVDGDEKAEFAISGGGPGWTPLILEGFKDYREITVEAHQGGHWTKVDQSVHGRDFWQIAYDATTGTFAYILCIPPSGIPAKVRVSRQ